MQQTGAPQNSFTGYQKFVVFILAITQFTVVLDFMVMSPLGDIMMKTMELTPSMFGVAVSAYAFSAGVSGILTAGFADRFDRKKMLLFFYIGFIIGTVFCGLAHTYAALVTARIITGLFGGVIGSISMAIITDLFPLQLRGRVMGFAQMGFGASQVLGIPISLYLANLWGWEAPFWMVAILGILVAIAIYARLQPVNAHLKEKRRQHALLHLWNTVKKRDYRIAFTSTAILAVGGFMMMPFGSAFAINNLGVTPEDLPLLFMVSGISSLIFMPFIGKLSDRFDKYYLFAIASLWMVSIAVVYTNMSVNPLWFVIVMNVLLMIGIMSRMVPSTALVSAVPDMHDRGAFMSINASLQQVSGGIAATASGMIVVQKTTYSPLEHYNTVAYIVTFITIISILLMYRVNRVVQKKLSAASPPAHLVAEV
ncbi:MAG: MFS transporter [Chitinophagaceae bacterium]|nr:MFS transporter [Chitinophagaceae bacterium]MCW5928557.1 MFS transporter [Chitinophagaceae bacterium]